MPHGSGGGSHGGGFSGHSSSHSFGGSHSGGFSGHSSSHGFSGGSSHSSFGGPGFGSTGRRPVSPPPPRPHVSNRYFSGARRYVYYRNHVPVYVYANETAVPKKPARWKWLIWAPIILFVMYCLFSGLTARQRLTADYDTSIVIEDNANCISDSDALRASMNAFFEESGITPAVITVNNRYWQTYYYDLEDYAYDLYVNHFNDEKHWLIVYSESEELNPEFEDWHWVSMQGDDTDLLLTDSIADTFGETLQAGLTKSSISVAQALADAFDAVTPVIRQPEVHSASSVITRLVIIAVLILIAMLRTGTVRLKTTGGDTLPADAKFSDPKQDIVCEYCGGVYPPENLSCPHCGAPKPSSKT